MNRLQKKCIIASTGIHLLLALMLIFGPGFLSSHSKHDSTPPLDFIPLKTIDAALSGGGDNTVKAPPAALTAPPEPVTPPAAVAPPVAEKTPPIEKPLPAPRETPREVKPPKSDVPVVEAAPRKHKIEVDKRLVTTNDSDLKAARDARAKAAADAKRRTAQAVSRTIAGIRGGVSGSTEVRLKGPGGGGVPYANFFDAVKKVYFDAWTVPDGAPDVTVGVTVTIARDGTVISARITEESGNAAVDRSVQNALDRVKFAAPLPDTEEKDQRTFTIGFDTETKLTG